MILLEKKNEVSEVGSVSKLKLASSKRKCKWKEGKNKYIES